MFCISQVSTNNDFLLSQQKKSELAKHLVVEVVNNPHVLFKIATVVAVVNGRNPGLLQVHPFSPPPFLFPV